MCDGSVHKNREMTGQDDCARLRGACRGGDMDSMIIRVNSILASPGPCHGIGSSQTAVHLKRLMAERKSQWTAARRGLSLFFCLLLIGTFLITGCVPEVLKQRVPVSTNPTGAKIYVNGTLAGETPTVVELERNQSHVLTLKKENYRQADVVIQRRKKTEEQLFKAINSGVTTGMMFKDPSMGMMRAMDAYSMQEKTGEAYELWPSAVTVELEPLEGLKDRADRGDQKTDARPRTMPPEQSQAEAPSDDGKALMKGALMGAAAAGAVAAGTKEKRWETSSSTKTSVRPDGTTVTTHSSTSVGVSVNPLGLTNLLDTLYK